MILETGHPRHNKSESYIWPAAKHRAVDAAGDSWQRSLSLITWLRRPLRKPDRLLRIAVCSHQKRGGYHTEATMHATNDEEEGSAWVWEPQERQLTGEAI